MRAWCIDPAEQSIEEVAINGDQDIIQLIGYDTIEKDAIDADNVIYFDEECFLRQSTGRFQIDTLIPVSGKAVILGDDGAGNVADVSLSKEDLESRLNYLD